MQKMRLLLGTTALAAILYATKVDAQSSPGWSYGFVPTAAQWNQAFAGKVDYVSGFVALNANGGTMLGELVTAASTTANAGFNITPGTAPNSPNNGDMWTTSSGLFVQINGSTAQLSAGTGGAGSLLTSNNIWSGTNQFTAGLTAGSQLTVTGTTTFSGFIYGNFHTGATTPTTGTGFAITNNYSAGGLETVLWNTGTSASPSFIFKQMTGTGGTFQNLVDIGLGTGSSGGIIDIYGLSGGKISLLTGSAAAGTWNWVWPLTAGNSGQILTSAGGTGAMTWTNAGAGTVTSAIVSGSAGVSPTGTCTITVTGNCTIGAFLGPPQGRLTLISGQPVMNTNIATTSTTSVTNGTVGSQSLFYAPYVGMTAPIYNGTNFVSYQFTSGVSDAVGQTLNLAGGTAWVANTVYDAFESLNGTALTLCTGSAWSTGLVRGSAAGLTRLNGVYTNTGTMTCRSGTGTTFTVNANRGTYLGTIATDTGVAGQITYVTGSGASGGSAAILNVWNYYNRVATLAKVIDSGLSYGNSSATTRAARASNSNRITYVSGFPEDGVAATYNAEQTFNTTLGATWYIGIGLNSTTNASCPSSQLSNQAAGAASSSTIVTSCPIFPTQGQNFLQAVESADGSDTISFDASSSNALLAIILN